MHCDERCWGCSRRVGVLGMDARIDDGAPCHIRLCVACWRLSVNLSRARDRETAERHSVTLRALAVFRGIVEWAARY